MMKYIVNSINGIILVFLFLLVSCTSNASNLPFTQNDNVNNIKVFQKCDNQLRSLIITDNEEKVKKVIALLVKHNHSWKYPLGDTAPSPPYKLELYAGKKLKFIIWYGNNTLSGRTYKKNDEGVRVKYLSPKKMENFANSIGTKSKCE